MVVLCRPVEEVEEKKKEEEENEKHFSDVCGMNYF